MTGLLYFLGIAGTIVLTPILAKLFFNRNKPQDLIEKHKNDENKESVFEKKYPEADVNRFTKSFTGVGMIVALSVVIAVFLYEKPKTELNYLASIEGIDDFEIEPPPTKRIPPPPPEPPPVKIEVVEPDKIIEEQPKIELPEIEPETVIDIAPPPEQKPDNEPDFVPWSEYMPSFKEKCNDLPKKELRACSEFELQKYVATIKYPAIARENDIEGIVYVRFLVDKKSNVNGVQVVRGADRILNDAAEAHIKAMPKWAKPGRQHGKAVNVQYVIPIRFKLN